MRNGTTNGTNEVFETLIRQQSERQGELAAQRADYQEPTEREANPNGLGLTRQRSMVTTGIMAPTFMVKSPHSSTTTASTTPAPASASVAFSPEAASQVTQAAKKNRCQEVMQMCVLL